MTKKLAEYSRKRNFTRTREPSADSRSKKGKKPIFVVQEHHASHLHYDFRLEVDGVLRSWSVPKGPSMVAKEKRLAVEVEDHPLAYAKFTGEIPKGQYGGGTVYRWDYGYWRPEGDPATALKKGKLEFTLQGKKLKGRFLLIRTSRGKGKPQWLLIKRTDEFADAHPGDAQPEENEKQAKRRREATNAAPGFLPLQFAQLVAGPPEGEEWIHEKKFDGYRLQAIVENGEVRLLTRTGLDWTDRYPPIVKALRKLDDCVIDGEVVWADDEGTGDFQKLQNALNGGDLSHLHYFVFDLLELHGRDLRRLPLLERKKKLVKILPKRGPVHLSEHVTGGAAKLLQKSCAAKGEGIVSKLAQAPYHTGRHGSWVKSKCVQRQEFVIGGFTEGKRQGFGALLLGLFENEGFRYVGRVGTGFTQKSINDLRARLNPLRREASPFVNKPPGRGLKWVEPKLAAEISFANWTSDRRLRAPVFQGLREDKPAAEIHAELPAQEGSLSLSNPQKIYFEEEGLSKLEVAEYYAEVAPFLLPHIKNRPLSLRRCPDGTSEECFYQKHYRAGTSYIEPVQVEESKGVHKHMKVERAEGIMALVQMGALEMHAWNCRAPDLEHPDQIVMDFDPDPSLPWKKVVAGAWALKEILDGLGLTSFVKVTGGKGAHVHIPIQPAYSWDQVKEFSRTLARELVSRQPDLYTTEMAKSARRGKIFLDYLRNEEMATAVLPYSLRAKEKSAVALPVAWEELGKLKGADEFTLRKALAKIRARRRDPWQGYENLRQRISILEKHKKAA